MANFTRALPLTGAPTNARLWLVFAALAGNNETCLDDLAISINTNYVPPPPPGPIPYATLQVLTNGASVVVEQAAKLLPRTNQIAWMNLEFTFFIHFGVNTFTGLEGGTGQESPSIFNPTSLDAGQWVREIKNAGGKQVVLVCKHVDGFCLWPSRYTTHSVGSSPWLGGTGDVVRAVSEACRTYGVKLGVYLSESDNHQSLPGGYIGDGSSSVPSVIPTAPASFKTNPTAGRTPPTDFTHYTYTANDYQRYYLNQLYELLTDYGPIYEVWYDGGIANVPQAMDLVRQLQPDAVMFQGGDLRWVGNESGVARDTEWSVIPLSSSPDTFNWANLNSSAADLGSRAMLTPGSYLWWYHAEADVPILNAWFWAASHSVKSVTSLLDIYYASVGHNANLNLDLAPDTRGLVPDNQLAALRPMGQIIANTFAVNLASGASVTADSANPTNGPAAVLDGHLNTWWEAAPGQTNGALTFTLPAPVTFDVVSLQEAVAQRSQRIESWALDTWNGSAWVTATTLTTVGHKRLARISPVTTSRVRIRVIGSRLEPTLAEVGLFKQAVAILPPTISNRDTNGLVTLSNASGYAMVFTLDGTTPTTGSSVYTGPIALPLGGTVQAACLTPQGQMGMVATADFAGWASAGWKVAAVDSQETNQANNAAVNAIDGNPSTIWHTRWNADLALPHYLTIDMGVLRWIGGFTYVPRQDGSQNGTVSQYRFETSTNGVAWTTNVAAGTFGNIRANPARQDVTFAPVKARFFRFTALQELNTNRWTSAAELSVMPAGFDAWRRDLGLQTNGPLSDPDGNGVPLLMEYFQGLAPGAAARSPLTAEGATNDWFQFKVRRQPGLVDVMSNCQVSADLLTWSPAIGVVTNSITPEADGTETLHLSLPQPTSTRALFLRLLVTQQ
ncbi:MAG: discoidin domain-containing protein [Verrucomicrobia bacterium]|nr:discoidin domain-containing protein [Verrucomicrobiota bacterium]